MKAPRLPREPSHCEWLSVAGPENSTPPRTRRRSRSWQGMPLYNETQDHLLSVVATTREDCTRFAAGRKKSFPPRWRPAIAERLKACVTEEYRLFQATRNLRN